MARTPQPYQAVWAIGMLWYGLSAGTEWIGGAFGWSELLYRLWYLIGAVWVAGWLGLGTAYLLGKTRFGYAFAISLFLAGLFTALTEQQYHYAGSGAAPILYFAVAMCWPASSWSRRIEATHAGRAWLRWGSGRHAHLGDHDGDRPARLRRAGSSTRSRTSRPATCSLGTCAC